MIIVILLIFGIFILLLAILYLIFFRKQAMQKKNPNEIKAEKILKSLKNSMKLFEYPKENLEEEKNEAKKEDVIDKTVDIFGDVIKKEEKKEKFYASKTAKNYHERGCLALKRVKKKISGTEQYFKDMKKKPCPLCMPSKK